MHRFRCIIFVLFLLLVPLFSVAVTPAHADEVITAAVLRDFPPLYSLNKNGRPEGLAIDILQGVAKDLDLQVKYLLTDNWGEAMAAVRSGRADLIPGIGISPERKKEFIFSAKIETVPVSCFVRAKNYSIKGIDELAGHRVGVIEQSAAWSAMRGNDNIHLVHLPELDAGLVQLLTGDIDALVVPEPVLLSKLRRAGIENKVKVVGRPLMELKRGFLFSPTNRKLLNRLNSAIERYTESPQYIASYGHWYGKPNPFWTLHRLFWLMVLLGMLSLAGLFFARYLTIRRFNRHLLETMQEREKVENALKLTQFAVDHIADMVLWISPQGSILNANKAACHTLGLEPAQQPDTSLFQIDLDLPADAWSDHWQMVKDLGVLTAQSHYQTRAGARIPVEVTNNYLEYDGNEYLFSVVRDITERQRTEALLEYQALYDSLTDLPNRNLLLDRLEQALIRSRRYAHMGALLFFDLDHFKHINDSLGHPVGDAMLRQVARRIAQGLRKEDTAARLGSDEFVVLLPNLGTKNQEASHMAQVIGQKLQKVIARPYDIQGQELNITVSIGAVLFPCGSDNANDLLKYADTAMSSAKDSGRNCIQFFLPSMHTAAESRLALENDLRRALEREQFFLQFQPQCNQKGQVIGAEALLRWQHPERGMVPPAEFIPLAEETGQILAIGEWVMRTACRQYQRWVPAGGNPLLPRLAVNVSARQFHHPEFVHMVRSILDDTGIPSGRLELELTESILISNIEKTVEKMNTLKKQGVRFSIDDFGTGYSSLSYLKRLPLDMLKIDRSFVMDISLNSPDATIVNTIIAMADTLGLQVIAEGVEQVAELNFLRDHGCQSYQGYYFSRPLSAGDFINFLRKANLSDSAEA